LVQFQQQISASLDDTYTDIYSDSKANFPTAPEARFGYNKVAVGKSLIDHYYDSFLRFLLNIPKGSTIDSAYLTLHAYQNNTADFIAKIYHTDEDDAADFSSNPIDRPLAPTIVDWNVPDFTTCQNVQTVDIKSLIQSFIDRAGYNENNHIAIRIYRGNATDYEYRWFNQWDSGANAAILTINYTPPSAPPAGYQFSNGLVCVQVK
jgi:hypothetical protein